MITLLVGRPGAGKTLYAVENYVIKAAMQKRKVFTNIRLNIDKIEKFFPETIGLIEYVPEIVNFTHEDKEYMNYQSFSSSVHLAYLSKIGVNDDGVAPIIVIDEAHVYFSRKATKEETWKWFTLHRHTGSDIILITQQVKQISTEIKNLAELYIVLKRGRLIGLGKSKYLIYRYDGVNGAKIYEGSGNHKKEYFKFYNSHIAQVEEQTTSGKSIFLRGPILMAIIITPLALIYFAVYSVPAMFKMFSGNRDIFVEEIEEDFEKEEYTVVIDSTRPTFDYSAVPPPSPRQIQVAELENQSLEIENDTPARENDLRDFFNVPQPRFPTIGPENDGQEKNDQSSRSGVDFMGRVWSPHCIISLRVNGQSTSHKHLNSFGATNVEFDRITCDLSFELDNRKYSFINF